ncbi:MAG TPA: MOSC domain-containing protein [Azospira sp.]|nr:MOSC domain-containing protein [Azospira sp.]
MNSATQVRLFAGRPVRIDDAGQFSAIWKQPLAGPVRITREGLVGDAQADRRVHGGPEKAVHHYAGENYARLAARFPELAGALVVGSIGENLSTFGVDEHTLCIGDVFRLGSAVLQISQPRRPCWKIDARYATQGVTAHIVDSGLTGWYYRVLEEGEAAPGADFTQLERPPGAVPLATLWRVWHEHRPERGQLAACADAPGLTPAWVHKIRDRLDWLAANPEGAGSAAAPAAKG